MAPKKKDTKAVSVDEPVNKPKTESKCKHCNGDPLPQLVPCPECTTQDVPRVLIDGYSGVGLHNAITKCRERRPDAAIVIQVAALPDSPIKDVTYSVGDTETVRDRFIVANPEADIFRKNVFMPTFAIIAHRREQNLRIEAANGRAARKARGGTGATRG